MISYKDFYKDLILESSHSWDRTHFEQYLRSKRVESYSGKLYHGTPMDGLLSMLTEKIWGQEHGELAEYETFSTSINENVLNLFAEHDKGTGLEFTVKDKRIIVLDDILAHLATRKGGSGIEFSFDEDEYEEFCKKYNIPHDGRDYYLPYNFFKDLGDVDGLVYEYTWNKIRSGHSYGNNDETEICFVGNSIEKLNGDISGIYIDWDEYDITEKEDAIERLKLNEPN